MGMNRPKSDKWPHHDPSRFLFISNDVHRYARPWQGYAVDWKRHGYKWQVLVVYLDDTQEGDPVMWRWVPAEKVRPVKADPNPPRDEWF